MPRSRWKQEHLDGNGDRPVVAVAGADIKGWQKASQSAGSTAGGAMKVGYAYICQNPFNKTTDYACHKAERSLAELA